MLADQVFGRSGTLPLQEARGIGHEDGLGIAIAHGVERSPTQLAIGLALKRSVRFHCPTV